MKPCWDKGDFENIVHPYKDINNETKYNWVATKVHIKRFKGSRIRNTSYISKEIRVFSVQSGGGLTVPPPLR